MQFALQVTITMDAQGRVMLNATGPAAENKAMIVGVMEIARNAVLNPAPEPTEPKIEVARAIPHLNGR